MKKNSLVLQEQVIPLGLTVVTFFALCLFLLGAIHILNLLPSEEKIIPQLRWQDILVGLTIYLKTSIDFAIFIGNLMKSNPGWKKRISIEVGTAVGNALGTLLILVVWNFFREVPILMAIMIFIASLVLLRMAEESMGEYLTSPSSSLKALGKSLNFLQAQISLINKVFKPILGKLLPDVNIANSKVMNPLKLMVFAFSIPFILGLDDFAGYIPLFNVINVYGFAVGVFLGHMILNLGLFLSPKKTVNMVRNPIVLIIGGLAFVGIALWGFYEVSHLLLIILKK